MGHVRRIQSRKFSSNLVSNQSQKREPRATQAIIQARSQSVCRAAYGCDAYLRFRSLTGCRVNLHDCDWRIDKHCTIDCKVQATEVAYRSTQQPPAQPATKLFNTRLTHENHIVCGPSRGRYSKCTATDTLDRRLDAALACCSMPRACKPAL